LIEKIGTKFGYLLKINPIQLVLFAGVPVLLVVVGFLSLLIYCFKKYPKVRKTLLKIKDSLFLGAIIKMYQVAYLGLLMSSNLQFLLFDFDKLEIKNILEILGILIGPIAMTAFFCKITNTQLKSEKTNKVWGGAYVDINLRVGLSAKLWIVLFCLRRLTIVLCLEGPFPMFLLTLTTVAWLAYLFHVKPFNDKLIYKTELINEIALYLLSYFMIVFSDYIPNYERRFKLGWWFIVIFILTIFVNVGIAIYLASGRLKSVLV
jgi:hypothetical protein